MSDDSISDAIETNATGPAAASADGVSTTQHKLPDQIAADRYRRGLVAARTGRGFRITKLVPGGSA